MRLSSTMMWPFVFVVGTATLSAAELPARPVPSDFSLRDAWVTEHFPKGQHGTDGEAANEPVPQSAIVVLNSYDLVFLNDVPGKGLAIADQKFAHGVYCHAPTRLKVVLASPAKSFSATVGVLTNPDSQGGSIVFSVAVDETNVYTSPVMHRGETGVLATADLRGVREFVLSVDDAGDGIASDQGVWGQAVVTLEDGSEVRLGDLTLRHGVVSQRWNPTLPFSFLYANQPSDEFLKSWRFAEVTDESDPTKTRRERTYTDSRTGLVVRNAIIQYRDFPTIEWTLSFSNTGTQDTSLISGIQALDILLQVPAHDSPTLHYIKGDACTPDSYEPQAETVVESFYRHFTAQGGRPTNGSFPYWNLAGSNNGLIAVLGWPGQWSAQFSRNAGQVFRLCAGQERTAFRLRPGETVRTPLAVLQFYQGDWLRGQNIWRRWMVAHNLPRPAGKLVPTHYGTCWSVDLHPDIASERAILDGYLRERIPLSFYFVDAGWFPGDGNWFENTGSWEVDRPRFPHGIRELSDHARAHGMNFVLWFEPERAAAGTWLAENRPEWILGGRNGGLVNLGNPDAWQWIVDRIDALITSEGVDVYRQDFNIDPLAYWRSADTPERQGITEISHVDGYLRFWRELLRRHPQLWIDSCASGGRRNDLETMRLSVPLLRSDYFNEPESQQCHTYGLSLWLPYHGSGLGASDEYWFRSCIFPASRVGWDTRKRELDYPLLRRMIAEYARVEPYLLSDFYPLTPYSLEKTAWIAWQYDDPEQGGGAVQAFRRQECEGDSMALKLRGLVPNAKYLVEDLDGGAPRTLLGRDLMEMGLDARILETPGSALFIYRRLGP